jgi:hypothetical protein
MCTDIDAGALDALQRDLADTPAKIAIIAGSVADPESHAGFAASAP